MSVEHFNNTLNFSQLNGILVAKYLCSGEALDAASIWVTKMIRFFLIMLFNMNLCINDASLDIAKTLVAKQAEHFKPNYMVTTFERVSKQIDLLAVLLYGF